MCIHGNNASGFPVITFSLRFNTRDFKIQRRGRQRERKKTIGFISKTTTLHVHYAFQCTFPCPFSHDYDVKMPNFPFLWRTQTGNDEILFLFLNLDIVPRNSSKWVGITAIKTERTQILFLSDVLVAVASLDLKVPTNSKSNEPKTP